MGLRFWTMDDIQGMPIEGAIEAAAAPSNIAIRDKALNLVIKSTATSPTIQVDIDADEIILTTSGDAVKKIRSVDLTVDITASGANGLDIGVEAVSTWYYLWVVYNATTSTAAGILSASATAPTLPAGYTYRALVGAIRNDAGSDLNFLNQVGNRAAQDESASALTNGVATDFTAIDLTSYVPSTAKIANIDVYITATYDGNVVAYFKPGSATYAAGQKTVTFDNSATHTVYFETSVSVMMVTPQTIYYKSFAGGPKVTVLVNEWEY